MLFRGYVLPTWVGSKLGVRGATLPVSVLWAAAHLQYDLYDQCWIVVLGVFLAFARLRTTSIYPPLVIHSLWNFVAMVQVSFYV